MVEQEAVNFEVAGSSPVPGANKKHLQEVLFCYERLSYLFRFSYFCLKCINAGADIIKQKTI